MKKSLLLFAAAVVAFGMNAQVVSTCTELSPATFVEETVDQAWVFADGISMKVTGKSYASANYTDYTGDSSIVNISLLKISKDKAATISIPSNRAVVKVAFYAVSNSSAGNWCYLQSFSNTADFPIMTAEANDVMENEAIQKLQYPISPLASSFAKPCAEFIAEKGTGWFEELNFYIDGNNQIAGIIKIWTVDEKEVESWDPATDTGLADVVGATSTFRELNPSTFVEETADQAWVFADGISMKVTGKSYASANYVDYTGDSSIVNTPLLKISKDKAATIFIPSNLAVVKVAFQGVSNSSAGNWCYLQSFSNTVDFPIMTAEANDVMENEAIQKLQYPISPLASSFAKPFAEFVAPKGEPWFEELNFYIDGNNQIAAVIKIWTISEADAANWDPNTDGGLKDAIETVIVPSNGLIYNLKGQVVTEDYQGIVIKDGKKYLNR